MISRFFTQATPKIIQTGKSTTDPQAHLIYSMEREFIGSCLNAHSPHSHLRDVAHHACKKWKVDTPVIKLIAEHNRIFGQCHTNRIDLNMYCHGDNLLTLLHELAHWIAYQKYDDHCHGPRFVGIYRWLLDQYKLLPARAFDAIAVYYEGLAYEEISP
jgi:hypothetical protein